MNGAGMDKIRALRYFLKVAETSNFTTAAKTFSVPASSVSRLILEHMNLGPRNIEDEIDTGGNGWAHCIISLGFGGD